MIRLNITAEGFSEERFISDILRPHLLEFGIYAESRKVLTNRKLRKRGGIVSYAKFKNDITQWFRECPDVYHSTLIDLYGLKPDFPGHHEAKMKQPYERIEFMEDALKNELDFHKFIPYIQLHEFESLLFSDTEILQQWLGLYNTLPKRCFELIKNTAGHGNPELINDNPNTAPSKRILGLCNTYDKVDDGVLILKEIGITKLREHCKHFGEWITKLEQLK